ncbi:MAG: hypothetical protein HGA40_03290 [Methanoregulaceae archaeon]|nr:hypothetical protein [Methanoregulaceae archaeon]
MKKRYYEALYGAGKGADPDMFSLILAEPPKKRFCEGFSRVRRRKSAVFSSGGDQTGKIGEVIRFLEEMENLNG